ncbi:MAG: NFACT family protein [Anaerolineales bacterium]|nr:NFACT family protein [Anaerolineales bacterium]
MYFDSLTTTAVVDELRQKILNGRVQRIVQVDEFSLGFEIYANGLRHQLLASADPRHPRLYLADSKMRRGVEKPTPILLLARKYLDGSRLVRIEQPPFERIIRMNFSGTENDTTLLVELIERRANLILLQNERILDAIQRVESNMNRYRTIQPNQMYQMPPPQPKLDPTDVTELALRKIMSDFEPDTPVWKCLVNGITSISPLFARELVFRATGNAQSIVIDLARITPLLDAYEKAMIDYWEHNWRPSIIIQAGGSVSAFAPYPLTHLGKPVMCRDINQALNRFYESLLDSKAYQAVKSPLEKTIQKARQRLERKHSAIRRQVPEPEELEINRKKGELLLAYASTISPGQMMLQAQYDPDGAPLQIELDPRLSPVANAQAYFSRYSKARRAADELPVQLARVKLDIDYLDQLETDLALAENWPEIDDVKMALMAENYLPKKSYPKSAVSAPLKIISDDGMVILVGRNSRQNEIVTFNKAASDDLWLHAHGVPGGHVVIKCAGVTPSTRTLELAAQLAVYHSAARNEKALVDIVPRKQVRRLRGSKARPGMVTFTGQKTIEIKPDPDKFFTIQAGSSN